MNQLQRNIKNATHYAAQQLIEEHVEEIDQDYYRNSSYTEKRKQVLDLLEENGFGRFLLIKNDIGFFSVSPVWCAHRDLQEELAWYYSEIFNVNEVQAYLNYMQSTETPLKFMDETYSCRGQTVQPGQMFHGGTTVHQRRNRIEVSSHGGIDC